MPQNDVTLKGGYISINSLDVTLINQEKSTLSDTKKSTFETEYGNQENYQIAKTCCNWETKQQNGYCITLYEPYFLKKDLDKNKQMRIAEALRVLGFTRKLVRKQGRVQRVRI